MNKPKKGRPSHSYIGVDNKTLHDTLLLLKEVDARSRVMFSKLHNLQVEVAEMKTANIKLAAVLVECLSDPSSQTEADAILRDFLNTKRNTQ